MVVIEAAQDQDNIGWSNFMEGKISTLWQQVQETHIQQSNSMQLSSTWKLCTIMKLLTLVHGQWNIRNDILHEWNEQRLNVADAIQLQWAIEQEFAMGQDRLSPQDHHYLKQGLDQVLQLPPNDKHAWIAGIQVARQQEELRVTDEVELMRNTMARWIGSHDDRPP